MSLLTICQDVADITGIIRPNTIIGNTDETSKRLLAAANETLFSLGRAHDWLELVTEHTFTTVASTEDYTLPSDFLHLVNQTLWDRTNFEELRGPLSPQQWQEYKSSILASTVTTWKKYRIRNVSGATRFSIHPIPDAADSLVFEYVSKNFCETSGGTGQARWAADSDVGVVDEYLLYLGIKWRMRKSLGMSYDEEREEYDNELDQAKSRNGGAPVLPLDVSAHYDLIDPYRNVKDTGFGT